MTSNPITLRATQRLLLATSFSCLLLAMPVAAQVQVVLPTDRTVLPIPEPQYPHSTVFDARNGAPEKGLERLAEAATLLETTQERWPEAELHRLRGTLLLSVHKQTAAEESYHQALSVAQRQSAKFWELRASLDLARLWCDQDKRQQAHDLLAPVYGWFTESFGTLDLRGAKALLNSTS